MNLPFFIAKRYLFAKKSHNVINIISAISAIGMAIGTAVLIIILSVYNGFDELIKDSVSDVDPDILVVPAKGKAFVPDQEAFYKLSDNPYVKSIGGIIEEEVFLNYGGGQSLAKAKGVDKAYEAGSAIPEHLITGEFKLRFGDIKYAAVGSELAYNMGINPNFLTQLEIYFPERGKNISLTNPSSSLRKVKAMPSCIFSISSDIDASLVIIPIETMRELVGYEDEVSAVEIRLRNSDRKALKRTMKELQNGLGEDFKVLDRFRQNESLYKMMRYEKASIFLILIFIIIVIAFNIFGSLSMLIIEKEGDIRTLKSMGATDKLVKKIFILEGWMISLLGLAAGLVIGLVIALLQQKFGFVSLPGNYLIDAYPVVIQWTDIALTSIGVAAIGYLIALLPASRKA